MENDSTSTIYIHIYLRPIEGKKVDNEKISVDVLTYTIWMFCVYVTRSISLDWNFCFQQNDAAIFLLLCCSISSHPPMKNAAFVQCTYYTHIYVYINIFAGFDLCVWQFLSILNTWFEPQSVFIQYEANFALLTGLWFKTEHCID